MLSKLLSGGAADLSKKRWWCYRQLAYFKRRKASS